MIALVQRVRASRVTVDDKLISSISKGYNVLLGICKGDGEDDVDKLVRKLVNLRVFEDEEGKMNLSIKDIKGQVLVVPQFTLCADLRKGRRPSFAKAEEPARARRLLAQFVDRLSEEGLEVYVGEFGAHMLVEILNDGPATFILDSRTL